MSANAQAHAAKWLSALPSATFPLFESASLAAMPAIQGRPSSSYHTANQSIVLGFETPLTAADTKETVQGKLKYLAPQCGTPGLVIEGWKTASMPPVSSFRDGVEISKFEVADGTASLEVKAKIKFFAVSGQRIGHHTPADAGMKKGDHFQERGEFWADYEGRFTVAL
jgi:hypothetical protein